MKFKKAPNEKNVSKFYSFRHSACHSACHSAFHSICHSARPFRLLLSPKNNLYLKFPLANLKMFSGVLFPKIFLENVFIQTFSAFAIRVYNINTAILSSTLPQTRQIINGQICCKLAILLLF